MTGERGWEPWVVPEQDWSVGSGASRSGREKASLQGGRAGKRADSPPPLELGPQTWAHTGPLWGPVPSARPRPRASVPVGRVG